jgi:hypothetical protein
LRRNRASPGQRRGLRLVEIDPAFAGVAKFEDQRLFEHQRAIAADGCGGAAVSALCAHFGRQPDWLVALMPALLQAPHGQRFDVLIVVSSVAATSRPFASAVSPG